MRELGKEKRFFLRAGGQQQRGEWKRLADANGHDGGTHKLHRVINGHSCRDRTTWRIDIQRNVFLRVFRFQKQQLGGHQIRDVVVDRRPDEDDVVLE